MRESFLHYIWQFQKFKHANLITYDGRPIYVIATGQYNTHAGPDFLNSKIVIDDITWYGNVELHLKSSDWNRHHHQNDEAYNNVILHVVWDHDLEIQSKDGNVIPVLELKNNIDDGLLIKCNELVKSPEAIPCGSQLQLAKSIDIASMIELSAIHRLENKSEEILKLLDINKGSWEETAHQALFRNFGFKRNSDSFLKLSKLLSHKILVKHSSSLFQIEALLFGMAGFLDGKVEDDYHTTLKKEYFYLSKKYHLTERSMKLVEWKFLRTRPGNFPTIRLAQLAAFYHKNSKFFAWMLRNTGAKPIRQMFDIQVSDYWKNHFRFGEPSKSTNHRLGKTSVENVLINTVGPVMVAYGRQTDNTAYLDHAIDLTMSLQPEDNVITRKWKALGIEINSGFDSQALVGLHNDYCLKKKCLSCKIGISIINQSSTY